MSGKIMSTKFLNIALFVSILFNMGAIGFYFGQGTGRFAHSCKKFMKTHEHGPEHKIAREKFREKFKVIKAENKEEFEKICMVKEDIVGLLGADDFNEELYSQKVSEMHKLKLNLMDKMSQSIKETASRMDKEERILFAQGIRHYMARQHHNH